MASALSTTPVEEVPLVVIVGPTASGKTTLAIEIAKKFGGEIICADSRTVYKSLDIGTAKPTRDEQQGVPHWGIDLVSPNERFTAADFKQYTLQKIHEIRQRGNMPMLVGGTGLYVDSVIFDYQFPPEDLQQRSEYEEWSTEMLKEYCHSNNIELPNNQCNRRHIISQICHGNQLQKSSFDLADNTIVVGITTQKRILKERIMARAEEMFSSDVIYETTQSINNYGEDSEALSGNIYPVIMKYINGEITLEAAKRLFATLDLRLAKRQMTWFRRNPYIAWSTLDGASRCIELALSRRTTKYGTIRKK